MGGKIKAGEYIEEEMSKKLAFKYLKEFSEKNNLRDDASILVVKAVEFVIDNDKKQEIKIQMNEEFKDFAMDKLQKKDLVKFFRERF